MAALRPARPHRPRQGSCCCAELGLRAGLSAAFEVQPLQAKEGLAGTSLVPEAPAELACLKFSSGWNLTCDLSLHSESLGSPLQVCGKFPAPTCHAQIPLSEPWPRPGCLPGIRPLSWKLRSLQNKGRQMTWASLPEARAHGHQLPEPGPRGRALQRVRTSQDRRRRALALEGKPERHRALQWLWGVGVGEGGWGMLATGLGKAGSMRCWLFIVLYCVCHRQALRQVSRPGGPVTAPPPGSQAQLS